MTKEQAAQLLRAFVAALERRSRRDANAAAFALLDGDAPLGNHWQSIAKVMQTNGEYTAANFAMDRYVAHRPSDPQARFLQAAMLAQTGQLERAWNTMDLVPSNVPTPSGHHYIRGTIAVNMGRMEQSEHHLLAALDADPRLGQAMLSLSAAQKRGVGDPVGNRILASEPAMANAPALERAHFHYAAGRVHFDRDEPDAAFRHFAAGAAQASTWRAHDPAADQRDAAQCIAGFDRPFIENV
ncbi:MAG: hypothetical protein C0409_14435, partial [Novosphingobium sp.]|nr:hypothetical protein [Novosphingobium sp.]